MTTHCRNVSPKELSKIEFGKEVTCGKKMPKVPYGAILRDLSIWGVWIANIGGTISFQIFFQYGPIYLNEVCFTPFISSNKNKLFEEFFFSFFRHLI